VAKLNVIDPISIEFVSAVRAEWTGDLAFTPEVLDALPDRDWSQVDILEAVEDGEPTTVTKEAAHETIIDFSHICITGTAISVTVSYDPHMPYLLVKEVYA